MVGVATFGSTGLLALLTWQALRGQSVVHPDAATLLATGALVVAVVLASVVALRGAVPATPVTHPGPKPVPAGAPRT